ncbi:MAG TPA: hypothetical protein DIC34_16460 [Treponema sp.]|nr:hypothetical protein [Treponema sp.]
MSFPEYSSFASRSACSAAEALAREASALASAWARKTKSTGRVSVAEAVQPVVPAAEPARMLDRFP